MNLELILPTLSQIIGRDLSKDIALAKRVGDAVEKSVGSEGKSFFLSNYPHLVTFMESEEGSKATALFLESWARSLIPKTIQEPSISPPIEPN